LPEDDPAFGANARIDNREMDRSRRKAGPHSLQHEGRLRYIEWFDVVGDVDDLRLGSDGKDDTLQLADKMVTEAVVGQHVMMV
jgi:hypothetical protein